MTYFLTASSVLMLFIMLLVPAVNIPGALYLKYPDIYINLFLSLFLLRNGVPRKLWEIAKIPALTLLCLTSLILGLETIFNNGDYTGIMLSIRASLTIFSSLGLMLFLVKVPIKTPVSFFFKIVVICAILQGLVLWLSFLSPDFRSLMSLAFHRIDTYHLIKLRVPGFVSSGGDGLSLNHALLCVVAAMGVYYLYPRGFNRSLLLSIIVVSNIGNAFTGKSGLYLGFVFIFFIIFSFKGGRLRPTRIIYFFAFLCFVFILLDMFTNQLGSYGLALREEFGYEHPIVRLLTGYISQYSFGTYHDNTLNILLKDMIVFPENTFRLFFGNNDFGQLSLKLIHSDIGYIRMIHGFGIFGLLGLLLGVYLYPLLIIQRSTSNLQKCSKIRRADFSESCFLFQTVLLILLFGLVSNWKIIYITSRAYLFVYFFALALTYLRINTLSMQYQDISNSRK